MNLIKYENLISNIFNNKVLISIINLDKLYLYDEIYNQEKKIILKASNKRKKEFSAGRIGIKKSLNKLGIKNFPILQDKNKLPIFPENIYGSISHTKNICITAISNNKLFNSIGIDIELNYRLKEKLWNKVLTNEEITWLTKNNFSKSNQLFWATTIFSIKESFFKLQYPITLTFINFKNIQTFLSLKTYTFSVHLLNNYNLNKLNNINGKFLFIKNYVITGLVIKLY